MSRSLTTVLAATLLLLASSSGRAMMADIPLPIIAAQSDLIVIGQVDAGHAAQHLAMPVPDRAQPTEGWYRRYTVTIKRTLKADAVPDDAVERIDIWTPAPTPAAEGDIIMIPSDTYFFDGLREGESYVMLLKRRGDADGYYLPSYPKNCAPAVAETVAKVERVADVERWPWGQAQAGLAIALLTDRKEVPVGNARVQPPKPVEPAIKRGLIDKEPAAAGEPPATSGTVSCVIALCNTTDKPITLTLYAEDRYLDVAARNAAGQTVRADFYSILARMDMRAFGPWATATIQPGDLLFIGPMGAAPHGLGVELPITKGDWQVTATYRSKRNTLPRAMFEDDGLPFEKIPDHDIAMWAGSISSQPITITGQ